MNLWIFELISWLDNKETFLIFQASDFVSANEPSCLSDRISIEAQIGLRIQLNLSSCEARVGFRSEFLSSSVLQV